jgi:hypothetical protein
LQWLPYNTQITVDTLRADLILKRKCGGVMLAFQDIASNLPVTANPLSQIVAVDTFVTGLGFSGQGENWRGIDSDLAVRILALILQQDLAYNCPLMSSEEAQNLIKRFLGFFEQPIRFFTNSYFKNEEQTNTLLTLSGWNSITASTFDAGIIGIDQTRIGILWVEDED